MGVGKIKQRRKAMISACVCRTRSPVHGHIKIDGCNEELRTPVIFMGLGAGWASTGLETAALPNAITLFRAFKIMFSFSFFFFLNGEGVERKGRRVEDEKGQEWGGPGVPRVAGLPRIDRPQSSQFLSNAA